VSYILFLTFFTKANLLQGERIWKLGGEWELAQKQVFIPNQDIND
jgi:hypothetical protein